MIVIYINGEGTAEKLSPQHVYQGSNKNGVILLTPYPTTTAISIAFELPDKTHTEYFPMTYKESVDEKNQMQANSVGTLSQYEFTIKGNITQQSGKLGITFLADFTDGHQTTQKIFVDIEPSINYVKPDEELQDAYKEVLNKLAKQNVDILKNASDIKVNADNIETNSEDIAKNRLDINKNTINILGIQGQIDNIEDLAQKAEQASADAVETANQAKETADGLADSIAKANATAQEAVETANGAVNDIEQYKNETDNEIESFKNTVNGQIADIESTVNSAVNTAKDAKSTADGLASSIAQANTTASEAKEIAEEALEQSKVTGTKVNIAGEFATEVNFDSDPQTQLNDKVNKSGDTVRGRLDMAGGAAIWNGNESTYIDLGRNGITGLELHAQSDPNAFTDFDAMIQAVEATSTTQTGSAAFKYVAREHIFSGGGITASSFRQSNSSKDYVDLIDGEGGNFGVGGIAGKIYRLNNLVNEYGQEMRGHKVLSIGTSLVNEKSGFYADAYERYTRSIVAGDGGDKFCLTWTYNNFPSIQTRVYNSGNLQVDGIVPYVEPTKLSPTTANGWTVGGYNLKFPSAGIYLVALNELVVPSPVVVENINSYIGFPLPILNLDCLAVYKNGWDIYYQGNVLDIDIESVAYKKLA